MGKQAIQLVVCCAALLMASACSDEEGGGGDGGSAGSGGTTTTSSTGTGPCAATACNDTSPDTVCETCIDANCAAEATTCAADSQSGTCIGCAEFLSGGDWEQTCDDSKALFATFLGCICGDGQTTTGACG